MTRAAAAILAALAAASACSCDILRPGAFEVAVWSPGPGPHPDADEVVISVAFTDEADRSAVENAFSLASDGGAIRGAFSWDGPLVSFVPYAPLAGGAAYELSIGTGARSVGGLSLDEAFTGAFSTKTEEGRPRILSSSPTDGGSMLSAMEPVVIRVSEPVDRASYRLSLSVSPALSGTWGLDDGGTEIWFRPLKPWASAEDYEVTVAEGLRDESGNALGSEYRVRFRSPGETEPPSLVSAEAVDADGQFAMELVADDAADDQATVNAGWERAWGARLTFSEPVSLASVESSASFPGTVSMDCACLDEYAESFLFLSEETPSWGSSFDIVVEEGYLDACGNEGVSARIYRIRADGPGSKPPSLRGIRMELMPGASDADDSEMTPFAMDEPYATLPLTSDPLAYPIGTAVAVVIELYLDLAEGASPDALSVMESLSVSATNGAVDFSARKVTVDGFAYTPYGPWSECARVQVEGDLTNRAASGVVSFRLGSGFRDASGNEAADAQSLPLLK